MNSFRLLLAPALVIVSSLGALCGCSGAASSSSTQQPPPPPDDGWSGRTNVEAVFESSCSGCHGSAWSSCWNVQASESEVEGAVSSGAMPLGGALSSSDKQTVVGWLNEGAPCSGTKPTGDDAGVVIVGGGAPTSAQPPTAP
jgi:mono/diheme cytochrome c family protein